MQWHCVTDGQDTSVQAVPTPAPENPRDPAGGQIRFCDRQAHEREHDFHSFLAGWRTGLPCPLGLDPSSVRGFQHQTSQGWGSRVHFRLRDLEELQSSFKKGRRARHPVFLLHQHPCLGLGGLGRLTQ